MRSYFRVPFIYAPFLLSESLEDPGTGEFNTSKARRNTILRSVRFADWFVGLKRGLEIKVELRRDCAQAKIDTVKFHAIVVHKTAKKLQKSVMHVYNCDGVVVLLIKPIAFPCHRKVSKGPFSRKQKMVR